MPMTSPCRWRSAASPIGPTQDRLRAAQETLFYVEEGLTARVCMQPLPIGAPFTYFGKIVITGYVERS
jgi:hypothetical protein